MTARDAANASQSLMLRRGYLLAAHDLAEPYPESVFTPLSADEVRDAVAAMNGAVPHASERMHAGWARHWADVLRLQANDPARFEQEDGWVNDGFGI